MIHLQTASHAAAPLASEWGEIEPSLLEAVRAPVPAFPTEVLPPFWREWVAGTARSAGSPADYVAQSVLAAVTGLAGLAAQVRITPRWAEPLVLWQAMIGPASSGKSSAMAPIREMLTTLEPTPGTGTNKPHRLVEDAEIDVVADVLEAHPRGVILWRDEASDLLARLGCVEPARPGDEVLRACWLKAWSGDAVSLERGRRRFIRFAVNLLTALRPERLGELSRAGEELVSRFLFAWPHAPVHASLTARPSLRDEEALTCLRRVADRLGGGGRTRVVLELDEAALLAFDKFVERLNAERREADGMEAAWLGKGPSTAARLAGVLHLLAWSRTNAADPSPAIGCEQVEHAIALWSDYYRPHAFALFHHHVPSEQERRARQVVRWLQKERLRYVSREDVRRKGLRSAVNAYAIDQILYRLQEAGILQRDSRGHQLPGRPASRWFVNPAVSIDAPTSSGLS